MFALSHRSRSTALGAVVAALLILGLPGAAGARADADGTHAAPVNARGTNVAAPDQQVPIVSVEGTSYAAPDQVDRVTPVRPVERTPVSPIADADDSVPTSTLLALIALALGLAAIGYASWLAVRRTRSRAVV